MTVPSCKHILVIGGPTASGKNEIALAIARMIPAEFINADSRQVYRHLPIGTNQPAPEQQALVRHHLFGFLGPEVPFTAAEYERLACDVVREIAGRGFLPVVVGGTGFYLRALLKGSWPVPPKNERLRARLRRVEGRRGRAFLHRMLKRLDADSASHVPVNDVYRVIRALEIIFQSGQRQSTFRKETEDRFNAVKVYLDVDRSRLNEAIERRTGLMFERGWVDEVRHLLELYPDFERMPASASLGYREIIHMLRGEMTPETCRQMIVTKTRQYAKRQLTWFRNQDHFFAARTPEEVYKKLQTVIELD